MDRSHGIDWLNLKQQCEEWTRSGDSQKIAAALGKVPQRDMPRRFRLPLANTARRAGLHFLGLRLLSPAVRAEATPEEMAEYGVLLQKIGSLREALRVLNQIDSNKFPEVLLFRTFCLFPMWDYQSALPLLREYISHPAVNEYSRTIGRVNLASALIYTGANNEAMDLLSELAAECERLKYSRLHGNTLELTAQLHVRAGRWALAKHNLESAAGLLAKDFSLDYFFVRKWSAVMDGLKSGDPSPVQTLRTEAKVRQHWESVRECDLFIARINKDEALFNKIYAGTPYETYRQRLREEFPKFSPTGEYLLGQGPHLLDMAAGELNGKPFFKPGMALHRFAAFLVADLYRPQRLAAVFAGVFPEENFNVFSSPNRVHQLAKRLREVMSAAGLNLILNADQGTYSLFPGEGVRILLKEKIAAQSSQQILLAKLETKFGEREFSALEARTYLKMSLTGFNRLLNQALAGNCLQKTGRGPKTRYKVGAGTSRLKIAS